MKKIIVVGLGPGSPKFLTREAQQYLAGVRPLYFRTMKHPSARLYSSDSKNTHSFDHLYDKSSDFEQVYRTITVSLIRAVRQYGKICYAVPGHPAVGEATVERLGRICPRLGIKLQIIDGLSFLEPLLKCLKIDLLDGVTIYDAMALGQLKEPCRNHLIIAQVYNRSLASRVKLKLLDLYSPEYPVVLVKAAGMPQESCWKVPLYALDHKAFFNHFTTLYLSPSKAGAIGDLIELMARLRAEDGCPWDRQQTHRSLRQYLIEEAYEVVAAIDSADDQSLCEELGDLLLQVVFHSQIAREENRFDFTRVVDSITTKLIRRHPHVFGKEKAADASQVKILWEQIKSDERNEEKETVPFSVDHALPALLKAFKLQKRAAEAGFDWPCIKGPLEKAREELLELEEACMNEDRQSIEDELGDFLFTVVNIARFLGVNPELALGKTISKFIERFQHVMNQAGKTGRPLSSFSLEELDQWWEEAKKIRKRSK
jgi:tetrapyrrole methylase family protein / MazG family protein